MEHTSAACEIGVHSSTPSHEYPVIRFPQEFKDLFGKSAHIHQTELQGGHAFVVTTCDAVGKFRANSQNGETETRLVSLESKQVPLSLLNVDSQTL